MNDKCQANSFVASIISIIPSNIEEAKNLWESHQWLYDHGIIEPGDHNELAGKIIDSCNEEAFRIITPWTNKLRYREFARKRDEVMLDFSLILKCDLIDGSWDNLSLDEKRFVEYALSLDGLDELWLVREMGFADVWLVFPELDYAKETRIISFCNKYLDKMRKSNPKSPKISFLALTPENFTGVVQSPPLRVKIGGFCDNE